MNFVDLTRDELLDVQAKALDAYEGGNPIMSDAEYDELVGFLNMENTANIGSTSKSSSYTVKHAFIMGSLDKVHTIKNDSTGEINFSHAVYDKAPKDVVVTDAVNAHLSKAKAQYIEFTPKFDGCSFDFMVTLDERGYLNNKCATRGDGEYGADLLPFITNRAFNKNFSKIYEAATALLVDGYDTLVIRGEAIVKNSVYVMRYVDDFANPRVFVSGTTSRIFDPKDKDFISAVNDIDYICYDYRRVNSKTKEYEELSWMNPLDPTYKLIEPFLGKIGQLPDRDACYVIEGSKVTAKDMEELYFKFDEYRKNGSDYALDGIVIKPNCSARLKNLERTRPSDMIAVKFITEKMTSTIVDIEWSVGLNEECCPTAIIEPVYKDGKEITRATLHGYSYIKDNKVGIGSRVTLAMQGDIVPGIVDVLSEGVAKFPDYPTYVAFEGDNNTPHLMKRMTDEERREHKFVSSAKALGIDGIKMKTAEKIYKPLNLALMRKGRYLTNLMQLMEDGMADMIVETLGEGKSVMNIIESLKTYRSKMNLSDIIRGLTIKGCGVTTSEVCANIISDVAYDVSGLDKTAYEWALDKNNETYMLVEEFRNKLGVSYNVAAENSMEDGGVKLIIMTGDPSECTSYATKKKWLEAHSQYKETTKWSECEILFTNNLESKTSKMAKAAKLGVEIKKYFD